MTKKAQRTPGEWKLDEGYKYAISTKSGTDIGAILKLKDAEFIVKAVNNHDRLVLLARAVDKFEGRVFDFCDIKKASHEILTQLDKGESP